MTSERLHVHNWDRLSPEVRAAIDRELQKLLPVEEWHPEQRRRLATLLGINSRGGDADA